MLIKNISNLRIKIKNKIKIINIKNTKFNRILVLKLYKMNLISTFFIKNKKCIEIKFKYINEKNIIKDIFLIKSKKNLKKFKINTIYFVTDVKGLNVNMNFLTNKKKKLLQLKI